MVHDFFICGIDVGRRVQDSIENGTFATGELQM